MLSKGEQKCVTRIEDLGRKLQVGGEKYEYNDVVLGGKIKHFKYLQWLRLRLCWRELFKLDERGQVV